jgi:hypothetical protein
MASSRRSEHEITPMRIIVVLGKCGRRKDAKHKKTPTKAFLHA